MGAHKLYTKRSAQPGGPAVGVSPYNYGLFLTGFSDECDGSAGKSPFPLLRPFRARFELSVDDENMSSTIMKPMVCWFMVPMPEMSFFRTVLGGNEGV